MRTRYRDGLHINGRERGNAVDGKVKNERAYASMTGPRT